MNVRASVSKEGVRLYAGAGKDLGLHLNLRGSCSSQQTESTATDTEPNTQEKGQKRPLQQPKKQEEEAEPAEVPTTPDSNATTLVLPGPRSDQDDAASSEVEVCATPAPKRRLGRQPLFLVELQQQLQQALVSPDSSLSSEHRLLVAKLKEDVQEALAPALSTDEAVDRTRGAVLEHVRELQARGQALLWEVEDSLQTSLATQLSPAASSRQGTPAKPEATPLKASRD